MDILRWFRLNLTENTVAILQGELNEDSKWRYTLELKWKLCVWLWLFWSSSSSLFAWINNKVRSTHEWREKMRVRDMKHNLRRQFFMSNVLHILRVVSENGYLLLNFLVLTSDKLKQVESEKLLATAKNAHEVHFVRRHSHPSSVPSNLIMLD